jgi:hypothetical protein
MNLGRQIWVFGLFTVVLLACGEGPEKAGLVRLGASPQAVERLAREECRKSEDFSTRILESGTRSTKVVHDGTAKELTTFFAMGEACLQRSIRDVWGVLATPLGLQWDESTIRGFEKLDPFELDHLRIRSYQDVDKPFHPSWYIEWNHRVTKGSVERPETIEVYFQKTSGTRFIAHWSGAILMRAVTDGITALHMELELRGARISVTNCTGGIETQIKRMSELPPDLTLLP